MTALITALSALGLATAASGMVLTTRQVAAVCGEVRGPGPLLLIAGLAVLLLATVLHIT